ncbi:MAG: GTPase HflX, partial [Candidatus Babeliales bacterium]
SSLYALRVRTLIIGVHTPTNSSPYIDSYFEEFVRLVETNRVEYDEVIYVKLRAIDTAYFFTKGKLQDIAALCKEKNIDHVIISEQLTPQQERNLTDMLECKVYDRTQLILDIFEKAAVTAEGKVQVEIARLRHKKTRLAGKGIHLSQQSGVYGLRGGAGETLKEKETRHIEQSILKLQNKLKKIERHRSLQRKQRLSHHIPQLCLVGYTNAGKSTLLNTLTKSNVLAEDKLFATLDTTTRELYIGTVQIGVLSDTIGFIQNLPHQLIDAFKATLNELHYADLILHVVDISNPNWELHIKVVHKVLDELSIHKDILYVFNKADIMHPYISPHTLKLYTPHVVINARDKTSLTPLLTFLTDWKKGNH